MFELTQEDRLTIAANLRDQAFKDWQVGSYEAAKYLFRLSAEYMQKYANIERKKGWAAHV